MRSKAKNAAAKAPVLQGWNTTDEEEIRMRQWRAAAEPIDIQPLGAGVKNPTGI